MAKTRAQYSLLRSAVGPALSLLVIGNFAYYAIAGANGFLAWGGYRRERAVLTDKLAVLNAHKAVLAHRAALLDPRRVDPDLADELVRRDLGVARPDELVVPLN
jgi:cell division protein FtsB